MRPFIDGPGTVVVAVDGSERSTHALDFAFSAAERAAGQVVAVHVARPLTMYDACGVAPVMTEPDTLARLRAQVRMRAVSQRVPALFVDAYGDKVAVLRSVVADHHADALVVSDKAPLVRRVVKAMSRRRRTVCPVIVLP